MESEKADDHSRSPPAHEEHSFEKESHRGQENHLWVDSNRKGAGAASILAENRKPRGWHEDS